MTNMDQKDSDGNVWTQLHITMGCAGCTNNTTVFGKYTCKVCGMMLCGLCGPYCSHHRNEVIKDETRKIVAVITDLVVPHRAESKVGCCETCWCWDLSALADQWIEEYGLDE
jgi:ribosomal protein S27E